ncbi:MAG: hypothetical protein ACI9H8_001000 [Lysobacterales bacterium]|jgi:hypothetical protein
MKKILLITLIVVLATVGYLNISSHGNETPDESLLLVTTEEGNLESEPDFDSFGLGTEMNESALPDLDSLSFARRIVEVPYNASAPLYENIDEIEDSELEAFASHNLAEALAGDLYAANRVVHAHRKCKDAPASIDAVDFEVQRMVKRYEWMAENRNRNRTYPTETELRESSTAKFENCRFSKDVLTADLREQLERMANQGHVAARYLYALWPPEVFGRSDAFLQQQEWSEKALNFTLANLTQGETAGLLAFGQSYANNGMFTTSDRFLGTAFIIAAIDCGLKLDYYASYVESFLNSDRFAQMFQDPRPEVLAMAEGLKKFCR